MGQVWLRVGGAINPTWEPFCPSALCLHPSGLESRCCLCSVGLDSGLEFTRRVLELLSLPWETLLSDLITLLPQMAKKWHSGALSSCANLTNVTKGILTELNLMQMISASFYHMGSWAWVLNFLAHLLLKLFSKVWIQTEKIIIAASLSVISLSSCRWSRRTFRRNEPGHFHTCMIITFTISNRIQGSYLWVSRS